MGEAKRRRDAGAQPPRPRRRVVVNLREMPNALFERDEKGHWARLRREPLNPILDRRLIVRLNGVADAPEQPQSPLVVAVPAGAGLIQKPGGL